LKNKPKAMEVWGWLKWQSSCQIHGPEFNSLVPQKKKKNRILRRNQGLTKLGRTRGVYSNELFIYTYLLENISTKDRYGKEVLSYIADKNENFKAFLESNIAIFILPKTYTNTL
jgi:hypothetical protein